MPLFDFSCPACEYEEKDVLLALHHTADSLPHCAKCGKLMEKQFSTFSPQFKGPGFHCNDYVAPTRGF